MGKYKISSNLAISENGFLFLPSTGDSFTLNQTGIFIINLLKQGKETEAIITELMDQHDVDKQQAERDFDDFINQLKQYKLVTEI